jgi:hypothetical protein
MALTTHNRKFLAVAAMLAGLAISLNLSESMAQTPAGPAVLTVAGEIGKSNRPEFDATKDVFFKYHQRSFTQAFEFDVNMLEALGMRTAVISYPGLAQPIRVEGPLLRDVLAAVRAEPGTIRVTALDGFTTVIDQNALMGEDWIVALKADGRYLSLGQQGPAWIVYARRDGTPATAQDEERWPWAAFLLEIE